MLEKMEEFLESTIALVISGLFLLCSFLLPKFGITLPVDPAWVTVILSGLPLVIGAVSKTIHNKGVRRISSAHLITMAMIASIAIGDLFAAGEVAFIMAIGELLEDMTTDRAKKGLKKLIALAPTQARKIVDGKEEMVNAEEIQVGDILRILPGEIIPVDGVIVAGETSVDQSIMTGESLPVDKTVGEEVYCGTINRFGSIDIRGTKVGEDSSLQKLIRMVQEAEDKKAPMERTMDVAAGWMVPAALAIAVVTGLVTQNIERAVTVLVVFCPCALVLATPTAIMAAIGQATKHGVVIKSGEALEKMGKVDTIAFDKTGTLTYGKLEVSDMMPFAEGLTEEQLLAKAASAEAKSEHPLGEAIVACAKGRGLSLSQCEKFHMAAGQGITAEISGRTLLCGNEKYLEQSGISISREARQAIQTLRMQGKGTVLVAEEGACIGVIGLSDVLRPEAKKMVEKLSQIGTDAVLLTGDNRLTAEHFAKQVGISGIRAELLPEQKVENVAEMQRNGKTVCMIGDGVNDAPALKTADVGVAMGNMGSDIAVEAADIALMSDDLSRIPYLKRLSNATVKTIKASITLSMVINVIAVALSVAGVLTPTSGALVHNIGSVFVVMIAALLYDRKFE